MFETTSRIRIHRARSEMILREDGDRKEVEQAKHGESKSLLLLLCARFAL